jgi:hypothetical protein
VVGFKRPIWMMKKKKLKAKRECGLRNLSIGTELVPHLWVM